MRADVDFADLLPEPPSSTPPLTLQGLGVRFGGVVALEGIDLVVEPGETLAIVGQNGAGKSTLLNAVSGLVRISRGSRISIHDRRMERLRAWQRARAGLGRAFQDPPLVDHMTCRDNMLVGARRHDRRATDRADALLESIGLAHLATAPAAHLSYGLRKLIDLGRSLMSAPNVLLLDEPTSGLDGAEQRTVEHMLASIKATRRLAVIMVEHHMKLVETVADRALVLEAGTVARIGAPREVLT